jgi:heat shock protein HslJ
MTERSAIEGIAWAAGSTALQLDDGRLSGTGGINRLMGNYSLAGTSLTFGPLATTMMAGPPEQMEHEQRLVADLARVEGWSVDGDQLVLCDGDGVELMRLAPTRSA